jgi:hypothetical protein
MASKLFPVPGSKSATSSKNWKKKVYKFFELSQKRKLTAVVYDLAAPPSSRFQS